MDRKASVPVEHKSARVAMFEILILFAAGACDSQSAVCRPKYQSRIGEFNLENRANVSEPKFEDPLHGREKSKGVGVPGELRSGAKISPSDSIHQYFRRSRFTQKGGKRSDKK